MWVLGHFTVVQDLGKSINKMIWDHVKKKVRPRAMFSSITKPFLILH